MLFQNRRITDEDYFPLIDLQQTLFFQLSDLSHHGTAVYAQKVCQSRQGKGKCKGGGVLLSRHQGKVAQQLFSDGALA